MATNPNFLNGGEQLGMPPDLVKRKGLFGALLGAGQPEGDASGMNLSDLVLGAKQFANPDNAEVRGDEEGAPPTRMPNGSKLSPIPTVTGQQFDVSNPDSAQLIPGQMRDASAGASLKDRVMDDPVTRQNQSLVAQPQENEWEEAIAGNSSRMQMPGPTGDDAHLQQLQSEYEKAGQGPGPLKLWQKILLGVTAPFGSLGPYTQERDKQQQMRQGQQGKLLSEIEDERRMQEQERLGTQRMTLQQQMESQREKEREASQERLFGQQNQLEGTRERARQQQQTELFGQQADRQEKLFTQQQSIEDQREASREKLADKRQGAGQAGSWQLSEDKDGNPILFNSKTAQTQPAPGIHKPGTFQKEFGGAAESLQYANNYMTSGKFTGTGDEALMEKFFDLAKPSSGFRMTQPQMDMLNHARSAMQGLGAQVKHYLSPEAPYFDDTQRKNIVQTMNDIITAKRDVQSGKTGSITQAGGAGGTQHTPGGQASGLQEGQTGKGSDGKTYVVKNGIWVAQP